MLRGALKQFYGVRSERLTEFGILPFRGKSGRTAPDPEQPEVAAPPVE